jgi:ApaG protein|tara:strand:+ start:3614 stop:3985 length:372 start_codon:yes stop_codon:yes gene_type:complete
MSNTVEIKSRPTYIPERSDESKPIYFFSYHITITNNGLESVQLLSRYWHITDGQGNKEDIHGPGVVGQTPTILPGQSFEYTSFCPLPTPIGFMEGSYRMKKQSGKEFDAVIKRFRLVVPGFMN